MNIESLEKQRKEALKSTLIGYGICLLIGLLVFFGSFNPVIGLFSGFISFIIAEIFFLGRIKTKYASEFKRIMVEDQLKANFDDITVDFENGFTEQEVQDYCLVDLYDRFYSDDYITGSYHGISFRRSDIKIEDVRKSGKTTTVVTMFEGPWMIFDFKKKFTHYTVVKEKEILDNGRPGGWLSGNTAEKIQTESVRFNDIFVIYTTNGQEAFYLLTPKLMEKIIELEHRLDGRLYLGFINGEFHVALDNRENAFEPSLFEKVDTNVISRVKDEIYAMKELVELIEEMN